MFIRLVDFFRLKRFIAGICGSRHYEELNDCYRLLRYRHVEPHDCFSGEKSVIDYSIYLPGTLAVYN